jgi:hypothetical protein
MTGPVTDEHTYAVIDHALVELAARWGMDLADDVVLIGLLAGIIAQAERCLPEAVASVRGQGATWAEIASWLGTSPEEAELRFDPGSPVADRRWPLD